MSAWREDIERVREALAELRHAAEEWPTPNRYTGAADFAEPALDALTAQMEELSRERDHAKIEVGREAELRKDAEQRVKELENALEEIRNTSYKGKRYHSIATAALAQSDPPEDSE